ncbi:MAG: RNA 2',3'-cyclic phosphodiesterase [Bacteroidota bacterium]|jgi:2'-5' RNA ligase
MPRVFLCIPINLQLRERLQNQQKNILQILSSGAENYLIHLTNPLDFHITINFFGNIKYQDLPKLFNLIRDITIAHQSFSLETTSIELIPKASSSIIWLRFIDQPLFTKLHETIYQATKVMLPNQDYRMHPIPHTTLLRIKRKICQNFVLPEYTHERLTIDKIELWESRFTSSGTAYQPIYRFALNY